MNKTRFSSLILGVMLIFGIYISLEVFGPSLKAGKTSRPYVGMGDLRRVEAQQNRNNDNGCSAMIRLVYSQNWPWC